VKTLVSFFLYQAAIITINNSQKKELLNIHAEVSRISLIASTIFLFITIGFLSMSFNKQLLILFGIHL